jgi:hypothetical protein
VRASDAAPRAAYDELVAQAAHQLRPGVLAEQQWLRRSHADLPDLADWELRRELRVIVAYLDTLAGQRDWLRPWFVERRQRLLEELRRRRRGAEQTDEQPVEQPVARQPKQSPAAPRTDAGVFLPWRGVRE